MRLGGPVATVVVTANAGPYDRILALDLKGRSRRYLLPPQFINI